MKVNKKDFRLLPNEKIIDKTKELLALKKDIDKEHIISNYYAFLSKKENYQYKKRLIEMFNNRCCYCGDSFELVLNYGNVELDHILSKTAKIEKGFNKNSIKNIAPSCHFCNDGKSDCVISQSFSDLINPYTNINSVFKRTSDLYIKIKQPFQKNKQIIEFYNGCKLYKEQHRLSYLLMYLESLKTVYKGNDFVYSRITQICEKLKKAFNHSILQ